MTIILNSEILSELIQDNKLAVLKKHQQNSDNSNYYFNPSIGLNLWRSKVMIKNSKFIVLEFNKIDHINLLILLRDINVKLQTILKQKDSELYNKNIYNIMSEIDDKFTIRCYLPNYKGKYLIKYFINKEENVFRLPLVGAIIDNCTIEIRNLWKIKDKCGFNIELKSVNFNM